MDLVERFLKYVSFDTQSDEEATGCPSTAKQMVFAEYLKEELERLGLQEISLDEHGYLFATLPANTDKPVPVIGFIAHMDTSPDYSGKDVKPRIVKQYDGGDLVLSAEDNIVTSVNQFPELLDHVGEDLIVTDGTTEIGKYDTATRGIFTYDCNSVAAGTKLYIYSSSSSINLFSITYTPN